MDQVQLRKINVILNDMYEKVNDLTDQVDELTDKLNHVILSVNDLQLNDDYLTIQDFVNERGGLGGQLSPIQDFVDSRETCVTKLCPSKKPSAY